jgi:hypothetical protein
MKNEQTIGGISFNTEYVSGITEDQFVEKYLKHAKKHNLMSRKTDAEKATILKEYYGQLKPKAQPEEKQAVSKQTTAGKGDK